MTEGPHASTAAAQPPAPGSAAVLALLTYRAGSLIHWKPREIALQAALARLAARSDLRVRRVLDIGCGHAPLLTVAHRLNLAYVGVDPDPAAVAYGAAHHAGAGRGAAFMLGGVELLPGLIRADDVVVLSGAAHHLDDVQFASAVAAARAGAALIVSDHWRVEGKVPRQARWLQDLDRGKFVRDYAAFENISGFTLRESNVFPIRFLGITLWPYFCNVYLPAKQP